MDKILSSPTPLTNDIAEEDHEENSLGLLSDAYAQSSQASAGASQKPATDAVAQPGASLPVGNALLRTSSNDAVPGLEIVESKADPKAAEPAPAPVSDNLLRLDRFSPTKVSDLAQSLNSGTTRQKLMMSDFQAQLNISQLYNGERIPVGKSTSISFVSDTLRLASRQDLSKPNGALSSLLGATTFDRRQPSSPESRAVSEPKISSLKSSYETTERAIERPQDSKVPPRAVVEPSTAESQAHVSKPAEVKSYDGKPAESGDQETRSGEPRTATRSAEPVTDARSAEPKADTRVAEPRATEPRVAETRIAEQRIAEPKSESTYQPSRQSEAGDVKVSVASELDRQVVQVGMETALNQPERRPATPDRDIAANTTIADTSGSIPETKSDARPLSVVPSIDNGATDDRSPAHTTRRDLPTSDAQRHAEAAILSGSERPANASRPEGQKRESIRSATDSVSLIEGMPVIESKPAVHSLITGSQRISGSPEPQSDAKVVTPATQPQRHTFDTGTKLQADNSLLPGSVDLPVASSADRLHEIRSAVTNLGGAVAQVLVPDSNASSEKRALAPSSNARDVVNPAQSPTRSDSGIPASLTAGSTIGQSVKDLLQQTRQGDTGARPGSPRFDSPLERKRSEAPSILDTLASGKRVVEVTRVANGDRQYAGILENGRQPKVPTAPLKPARTSEEVIPATPSGGIVTAPKGERPLYRATTDGATPKVDNSARPRTETRPGAEPVTPLSSREPVRAPGAVESRASHGQKPETVKPSDFLPAKPVDSLPGARPAEQSKPSETKPVETKLAAPSKPADSAQAGQAPGDRQSGARSEVVPAKQQDGTIIRDSLPRLISLPVSADRAIASSPLQAVVNGQSDRGVLPPVHRAPSDTTGSMLSNLLNSQKTLSRQLTPGAGELLARNLPDYLGNQGHRVSQAGRQLTERVFETFVRDSKPAQPPVSGKPHFELGNTLPWLHRPAADFKPVGDQKVIPTVKEAPTAVTRPSVKPQDFVAPTRGDSIRVTADTTRPASAGDVVSGRSLDSGRKPLLPVVNAALTPRIEVKGTVKGDAPRALQEISGSRVNTGFRPVKEGKTSTDASAPASKVPVDRTAPGVKGDATRSTRSDSTIGVKVPAPQEIKANTTPRADVNGLPRRDAKHVISESPKGVKATEVKAAGIKPVDVAGAIKSNSPRAVLVDTNNPGRKADAANSGRRADQTKANIDARVNRTDSTRIVKGDSVPVVKVDASRVSKVDVARVIKADQQQVNVSDRNSKVIVAKTDSRSIKADTTSKGDAIKPATVKPAIVDLTKFDLSKSAKAEVIRSIKSNVPQLAEQIRVAKSDVPQIVKIDANGLRKVDAAKVIKSGVAKFVEPKTVKIDATSVKKPEVANIVKTDAVKFNTGRAAESKVEVRVADARVSGNRVAETARKVENGTAKVENGVAAAKAENRIPAARVEIKAAAAKVENATLAARVDKRVSSANIEIGKAVDVKLTGSRLSPIDSIQTVKVGLAQFKGERATTAQIDRLFGKFDNSVKISTARSLAGNEFVNKVSERANLKSAGQTKLGVKASDIAVVRVENATISGDVLKSSSRDISTIKADSNVVIGKEAARVDGKSAYAEAKAELRRILKGERSGDAKTTESKEPWQAVWPIEGLLVRGRVGGIRVKEAEETTSTLKVSQEFEEYLYEDETSDFASDAYYFPGLKAALKFCEVVGLVELEEKLEQQKKADSEKQDVKGTLSPARVKYEVKPGDTLQSIAIEKLGDDRFVDLIVTINRSEVTFRTDNGVRVPLVFAGQLLWLPSEQERSIYQKHYFSGKAGKGGSPCVQASTGEDSATRTARVSAQEKLHSEAMREQFAPQADSKATRLQRKRLPSDSTPIAQTLEKLRFAGNRQSVRWNEVNTGDPISGRESYQVKLGETLQSIALNHPRMGDVRFWVVIATLNDLPTHVDQYGQPIAIIECGQLLVLPTALELIDFCTTGNITGPVRRSRNTGSPGTTGDTVVVPNLAVSICQIETEKIVEVRNFTPTARMIVSESSTDMDQFSVKLQVVVGYEWKLIASYDSFRGTATRTRYGINGVKATMRLNLPLPVVREMAVEDFSRNWTFHRDAFEANRPESRERTSGFQLRPVV